MISTCRLGASRPARAGHRRRPRRRGPDGGVRPGAGLPAERRVADARRLPRTFSGLAPVSHRSVDAAAGRHTPSDVAGRRVRRPDRLDSPGVVRVQAVQPVAAGDVSVHRHVAGAVVRAPGRLRRLAHAAGHAAPMAAGTGRDALRAQPASHHPLRTSGADRPLADPGRTVARPARRRGTRLAAGRRSMDGVGGGHGRHPALPAADGAGHHGRGLPAAANRDPTPRPPAGLARCRRARGGVGVAVGLGLLRGARCRRTHGSEDSAPTPPTC